MDAGLRPHGRVVQGQLWGPLGLGVLIILNDDCDWTNGVGTGPSHGIWSRATYCGFLGADFFIHQIKINK